MYHAAKKSFNPQKAFLLASRLGYHKTMSHVFISPAQERAISTRHGHYERLGTVPLDMVLPCLNQDHQFATVLGQVVRINGLRLKTFAMHAPRCSSPHCSASYAYFAVERILGKGGAPAPEGQAYHLNLYGVNEHGNEVLFTHDHTLARALGGANDETNTTPMCLPCNHRKSIREHAQVQRKRREQGLPGNLRGPQFVQQQDTLERETQKTLARLESMAQTHGVSLEDYKALCEAQGERFRQENPRLQPIKPYTALAERLGLSTMGFRAFRHDHNQHQLKLRRPQALSA